MKKKQGQAEIIKKVLRYVRPYGVFLLISVVCAAISSLLALVMPILTGLAVDMIITKGQVDFDGILGVIKQMALCIAAISIAQWGTNACSNRLTYDTVRDIRRDAMEKLQKLPLAYNDKHPAGETVSRMIADVDQFADGLLLGFNQFFNGVITIVGTLVLMLMLNPLLTIAVVVITPLSFFVAGFIAKNTFKLFKRQSAVRGEQTALIEEMCSNVKTVQAFSYENEAISRFAEGNEVLKDVSLRATFFSSMTNPCTRFVNNIAYALVTFFGAILVVGGKLTVGGLSAFLSYANQYTKPFNEISGVITELQNAIACAGRVFELIEEEAEVPDAEDAAVLSGAKGIVDIENVNFSYTEDKELIKELNLHVDSGSRIAIVGPTGCGKTTLINLLMRFYDVNEGSIKVDGLDIRNISRKSLRSAYGMVLQETWLKPGTVRDNIRMGRPDATDEEVIAAAKASHAHSFIKQLKDGYDTVLGEGGGLLSQGQKQLLCIARIMLGMPPMLILDEATSSIDTRTELKIQDAFAKMMKGRTSFIVAHRLSTIKEADRILVMKDGNIIEQGTHTQLLAERGFYHKLYHSQWE
ncbi:MAG: ABC transporter ATP-binding protein/permease [Lachnospiraceae bacterium]|nr:ABC transporter ATP-binding protein/permease [Lachnospiraceae bacterium]